jgi:hypothetical protein
MNLSPTTLDWLLAGDPAIRWQVQRDLLDAPPEVYAAERARVVTTGWGADLLARQDPSGTWAGKLYSPKWTSTTYTLLLLRHLGLPPDNPQAQRGCERFWDKGLYRDGGLNWFPSLNFSELCVNGMLLALLSYFRYPDERVHAIAAYLLTEQMPDGGWNCERQRFGAAHSSFHTTISVLEGLAEYGLTYPERAAEPRAAAGRAHELLLSHHLYRSHRTGQIIDPAWTRLNFPPRWRYDFIRALDYFRWVGALLDERMADAIDLLRQRQTAAGRWLAYRPYSGRFFFQLEAAGQPGRWNTLRALRVLKWWEEPHSGM